MGLRIFLRNLGFPLKRDEKNYRKNEAKSAKRYSKSFRKKHRKISMPSPIKWFR